jgi:hypothetical protein
MKVLLPILVALLATACEGDSRKAAVADCVAAQKRAAAKAAENPYGPRPTLNEGGMHVLCMRAAYGTKD